MVSGDKNKQTSALVFVLVITFGFIGAAEAGSKEDLIEVLRECNGQVPNPISQSHTLAIPNCPACNSPTNYALGQWDMPPGVLSLPKTQDEALNKPKLKIDLRRCADCGHVYNGEFDPKNIDYEGDSTRVFNTAPAWVNHQKTLAEHLIGSLKLSHKRIVEVGCGKGEFLVPFLKDNEVIGFEPGSDANSAEARGIRMYRRDFEVSDFEMLRPDVVVFRHVLEHIADPRPLLKEMADKSREKQIPFTIVAEVPRIDKALGQQRIQDFFYEHVQHFTEESFRRMFEEAGYEVIEEQSRYGDEVVVITARPRTEETMRVVTPTHRPDFEKQSVAFAESVPRLRKNVRNKIDQWSREGKKIALWGGAGKGAAMSNILGFNLKDFPFAIDSDLGKAHFFVPGTGQEIFGPSYLKENASVDGILICTNWRARDIEKEIRKLGITVPLYVQYGENIVELTPDLPL